MYDCVVIGAGLAGLTLARSLTARGLSVVVVEARSRVGGRIENAQLDDGQYVELGGQWIGPGHDEVRDLAQKFDIQVIDQHASGKLVARLRGHNVAVPSASEVASELTAFEVSDLGQGVLRLRRLADRMKTDAAWVQANQDWLRQDLRRWIATNLRTPGARRHFHEVYAAAYGPMSADATLEEGLHQVGSGPDVQQLLPANGGLNQRRLEGGMFTLCQAMADELGDVVRLDSPVAKITHTESSGIVTLRDGATLEGRWVVNTMPPRLAVQLEYEPQLPQWRVDLSNSVTPGNVIKAVLVYETPFWREQGYSGQSSVDQGAVRVTFDTTTGENQRGLLMGFFEGEQASSLARRSQELRKRAFVDSAAQTFGEQARTPVDYFERDWSTEEFTGGCHGAHFAPGAWTANGPSLAQPEGRLIFAGAEYAEKFNGYMEGAIRSGLATAALVAQELA